MEHRVHVFERRAGGTVTWTSLASTFRTPIRATGSSVDRVEKAFLELCRAQIAKLSPQERSALMPAFPAGIAPVKLALTLRGELGKREIYGTFPFVLEHRRLGATGTVPIYFHPYRPEDRFTVRPGEALDVGLRPLVSRAWADVEDHVLESLTTQGKERIHYLALDEPGRTLAETLSESDAQRGAKPSRLVKPPLIELKRIGVDLTRLVTADGYRGPQARLALDRQLGAMLLGPGGPSGALLTPPTSRSFVVVGESGSGLSTAIERAAFLLAEHDGYAVCRNFDQVSRVYRLSARAVLAGMSRLGEWEKRLYTILEECRAHRVVLAFDDVTLLGSIGRSRQSDRAFADVLAGPIARGEVAIWGETTTAGLERLLDEAPRLAALLTRVHLAPAESAETLGLLLSRVRQIEELALRKDGVDGSRRLEIDPLVIPVIARQAQAVFGNVAEPQRSMQVLARVAARIDAERQASGARVVDPDTRVLDALEERTGLPRSFIDQSALDMEAVRAAFEADVVGQAEATRAVIDLAVRMKSGLTDAQRPRAVYLFTGPTGTGKTETAKWIARHVYGAERRLLRLDMAEYASPHSAARLLVGDGAEGGLPARVAEDPFSVVLFDEIEKAHPGVLYLLLQLFDEGRLSDGAGLVANFTSATVVMTSNLGASGRARAGFSPGDSAEARAAERSDAMADIARAVKAHFPPELFHRIDRIVPFRPLDRDMARGIVRRELARLFARPGLTERHVAVRATDALVERAVDEAFDARGGARSVKRWLEAHVGTPLSETIARAGVAEQRSLVVYVRQRDGALAVHGSGITEVPVETSRALAIPTDPAAALALAATLGAPLWAQMPALLSTAKRRIAPSDQARFALDQAEISLTELEAEHELLEMTDSERERERYEDDIERGIRVTRGRTFDRRSGRRKLAVAGVEGEQAHASLAEHIVRLLAFRRAMPTLSTEGAHVVDVVVESVGHSRAATRIWHVASDLIRWGARLGGHLVGAYRRWRRDGSVEEVSEDLLADRRPFPAPPAIALRIVGLGARQRLTTEHGTHVYLGDDRVPELIVVRVLDHDPARRIERVLLDEEAGGEAFRRALEQGADPPPRDPSALLPRVRTVRLERQLPGAVRAVVEDLRLGDVVSARVKSDKSALEALYARLERIVPADLVLEDGSDDASVAEEPT